MIEELEEMEEEYTEGEDNPYDQPLTNQFTDVLYYQYDFGDSWRVKIQGSCGCEDLIEAGRITQEELDDVVVQIFTTYRPVVIAQDGMCVLDDVGGMHGYCEFLKAICGDGEYDGPYEYGDKKHTLAWAKSMGWSKRRHGNKSFL